MSKHVAIVILNWNGRRYLEQFLPSVTATSYNNYSIIVADNGSTDDSIDFLRSHYPAIRLIQFDENLGFTSGYNKALEQVEADYYMLLNSDVEVEPQWLDPMVSLLDSNDRIAACQPKLRSWHDRSLFEYAGAAGGWLDRFGYPFSRGRVFEICEKDNGQYDDASPIFWATGAALFIRPEIFKSVGGFDPYFFAHQEEIDLCWRIQLAGYEVWACPDSIVYHVGGGTLPRGNSKKTYLNFRNNHIMMLKNLPIAQKLWVIPVRLALDWITALKGLLGGDGGYSVAIIRAHWSVLRWVLGSKKRNVYPQSRRLTPRGVYKGNIVWQHFAKKKQRFSEIVKETD